MSTSHPKKKYYLYNNMVNFWPLNMEVPKLKGELVSKTY